MTLPLFEPAHRSAIEPLGEGAMVLRGFVSGGTAGLLDDLHGVIAQAPWRHMITPGGFRMSVAMTNCGSLGWVSDASGYRYVRTDPLCGAPWPAMPASFLRLAHDAAEAAGFDAFVPDACLVNRYEAGTKLSLHQDKDERDLRAPIVSVSLGIPAMFLFGGLRRADPVQRVRLEHGDVVVWGGPARLRYHGVAALKPDSHAQLAGQRINLTFRRAG